WALAMPMELLYAFACLPVWYTCRALPLSRVAAAPELPRQHGARSQGQACEIRNGAPLPGSDSGEGARSKWREAAARADRAGACGVPGRVERQAGRVAKPLGVPCQSIDGEGAYTDVRDRAGYGEPRKDAAARLLSPRPTPQAVRYSKLDLAREWRNWQTHQT